MQTYTPTRYHLADLHKEIDLFDRKIAYCQQFEKFDGPNERAAAVSKLQKKRASLLKTAMSFTAQGIEFDPKSLPRSLVVGADGKITEVVQPSTSAV